MRFDDYCVNYAGAEITASQIAISGADGADINMRRWAAIAADVMITPSSMAALASEDLPISAAYGRRASGHAISASRLRDRRRYSKHYAASRAQPPVPPSRSTTGRARRALATYALAGYRRCDIFGVIKRF